MASASNSVVAHNWANQTGGARNGSNFYYEGQILYSYGGHFAVGAITDDGKTAILNSLRYSNTTAKHQRHAARAVSHLNRIWCTCPESALRGYHSYNLTEWQKQARELIDGRADRSSCHKFHTELMRVINPTKIYIEYFSLSTPEWLSAAESYVTELENSPKWAREQELASTKEARRVEREKVMMVENLFKFRAGEIRNFSSPTQYLRFNGDNICTSLGVCISVREFTIHYNRLINKESLVGTKVDDKFAILSVSDEAVKIGCHTISREEIDSIARQIKQ